jgi:pimeloyl-[acyl-carrier protein] methyl ester esterase
MPLLEPHFRVTRVDLPGHGNSPWSGEATLDAMVGAICSTAPDSATWLGWSLGGLIATRAAMLQSERVQALITVASSPCFMRKPDWQSAMLPALLDTFADELAQDYQRTLDRFLALQARGSEQASSVLKLLRAAMQLHGEPQPEGLQAGLKILRETDLRTELDSIHCQTLLIGGERDTLVPVGTGQATLPYLSDARLETMAGAGHAPFVSDPVSFAKMVTAFVKETQQDRLHA